MLSLVLSLKKTIDIACTKKNEKSVYLLVGEGVVVTGIVVVTGTGVVVICESK